MREFFIGTLIGSVAGLMIGGIMVARNKKLSNKINQAVDKVEEKVKDAKDALKQKLENCKIGEDDKLAQCESNPNSNVCC